MKSNVILVINNADATISIESKPIPLDQIYGFAGQYIFSSGSAVGSIKLQASCDPLSKAPQPTAAELPQNWDDITDSAFNITAGGTGIWNFNGAFYNWVRVVWTPSAGAGTLFVQMSVKG